MTWKISSHDYQPRPTIILINMTHNGCVPNIFRFPLPSSSSFFQTISRRNGYYSGDKCFLSSPSYSDFVFWFRFQGKSRASTKLHRFIFLCRVLLRSSFQHSRVLCGNVFHLLLTVYYIVNKCFLGSRCFWFIFLGFHLCGYVTKPLLFYLVMAVGL